MWNRLLKITCQSLFIGILVFPLAMGGCSKKKEPDTAYESESGEEYAGSDSEGKYGESELGEGSASGLETVYFDYDSSTLTNSARQDLKNNAGFIKSKGGNITVEGHCDERGSAEYNLALGERRANAVRDYLVNLGVKRGNMRTISYGEERPATRGSGENAWSKNRRAEFIKK